jgi:hypothetical protein
MVHDLLLSDLFTWDRPALKERLSSEASPDALNQLREKLDRPDSQVPYFSALDGIGAAIRPMLDIRLVDILVAAWKKYLSLRKFLDTTQYPPERIALLPLLEHTLQSTHHPWIEFRLNDLPAGKLVFTISLSLVLKGMILVIQDGRIKAVQTGECLARGSVSCAGVMVLERVSAPLKMPGTLELGAGIAIG